MSEPSAQQILDKLAAGSTPFRELTSFSDKAGIYAVFLCGCDPLRIGASLIPTGGLLYIGRTERSQMERDADQHFTSGKTGGSTLRRSLGALLIEELPLLPQPRSLTETGNRAFTHYRFDDAGEECLTVWMVQNLALSFYEYPEEPAKIGKLEGELIRKAAPPLNINKNPDGLYRRTLMQARAECAKLAKSYAELGRRL